MMNKDIFVKLLQERRYKSVKRRSGRNERSRHCLTAWRI